MGSPHWLNLDVLWQSRKTVPLVYSGNLRPLAKMSARFANKHGPELDLYLSTDTFSVTVRTFNTSLRMYNKCAEIMCDIVIWCLYPFPPLKVINPNPPFTHTHTHAHVHADTHPTHAHSNERQGNEGLCGCVVKTHSHARGERFPLVLWDTLHCANPRGLCQNASRLPSA